MKRSALFILIISVFSFQLHIPASAAQYEHILLYVDGREITNLPEPPFMYNDRVLVPAREVFESAGAIVTWEESTQQVLIFYNASLLVLTVNSNNAWLDGSDIKMDVPPLIKNNKVMIPLRFPAECFNFEVDWNGRVPAAYLFSPEPPLAEPTPLPAENINEVILPPEVDIIVDDAPNEPAVAPFKAIDISEREIPAVQFGTATITDLLTPHDLNMAAYTAVSSGPISEVQKTLLPDNRLIIDIYNALNRLEGPFDLHGSVPISGLRASQFMDYPSVTRIVFDVTGAAEYSVMLSDDRTRLTVSFEQNGMNESRITSNGVSDSLTITGSRVPLVQVYPGDLPNQFIINVDKPVFSADGVGSYFNGAFINQAEYSETPNGGGRILLYLNEIPSFNVTEGINSVTVNFYKNTIL